MASGTINKNMVLLWTNPNPNEGFGTQTHNFDYSQYNYLLFSYWYANNTDGNKLELWTMATAKSGNKTWFQCVSSNNVTGGRSVTVNANGVTFGYANYGGSQRTDYLIPLKIYGIKA